MVYPLNDKYINLLTDFGFKLVFGTEPNKQLLIDFLNTLLPADRQISELSFKNSENLGNTPVDRKAIFDIYCQGFNGERFIVEIQKAKQNFFKDRSIYYATFPVQEQALKGDWDYRLSPVYAIGILDFIFDDHKNSSTFVHTVELKDQECQVFYDKLKFIYIELPKFQKTLDQLDSHFDKWMYLLKNLANLTNRPLVLQEEIFNNLFDIAEIANFTPTQQSSYQDSLKYYRDMNNVVDTSRQEGVKQERKRILDRQQSLIFRLLERVLGEIQEDSRGRIQSLSLEQLEALNESLLDFNDLADLNHWLDRNS
jgi:predicted transposase/invertase (TIGR01784 family)